MAKKRKKTEMFTHKNSITYSLERRANKVESKRRIVELANGPLFYVFGYNLTSKETNHDSI